MRYRHHRDFLFRDLQGPERLFADESRADGLDGYPYSGLAGHSAGGMEHHHVDPQHAEGEYPEDYRPGRYLIVGIGIRG